MVSKVTLNSKNTGDYDGDRVQVFWNPSIVRDFRSADKKYATEPESVRDTLEKVDIPVKDFLRQTKNNKFDEIAALQSHLLGSLRNPSLVGTYSTYWENSIYTRGYFHEDTIRLAYTWVLGWSRCTYY